MARYRVDIEIQAGELIRRDRVTAVSEKHLERIRRNAREIGQASPGSTVTVTPTKI